MSRNLEQMQLLCRRLFNSRVRSRGPCAFCTWRSEDARLVCSALFDGCFLTLSPARRGDGIMCSGAETSGEKSRAAALTAAPLPPPQTPHCEKSLGWALRAWRIHRLAKCRGQTERHGVLGLGSFFPVSQRLCLIMRAEGTKKKKKLNYTHVSESWCLQGRDVVCCCVSVPMATLTWECRDK